MSHLKDKENLVKRFQLVEKLELTMKGCARLRKRAVSSGLQSKSDPMLKRGRATKKAVQVNSELWKGSKCLDIFEKDLMIGIGMMAKG